MLETFPLNSDGPRPRAGSGTFYPNFPPVLSGSNEEQLDDLVVDEAVGGGVRVRAMYPARKRRFVIKHTLSLDDVDALLLYYDLVRLLTFSLTWPPCGGGTVYTCVFEAVPKVTTIATSVTHRDVEVKIRQV